MLSLGRVTLRRVAQRCVHPSLPASTSAPSESRRCAALLEPQSISASLWRRSLSSSGAAAEASSSESPPGERHEFQAETRQLLDIVARSLYSEKEVFIRELISNASDALEKLRYLQLQSGQESSSDAGQELAIRLTTDAKERTLIIEDSGVGMTKEELVHNLGTIARSGSKEFVANLAEAPQDAKSADAIIGQFGVGFYSAFMVASRVEVLSRSHKPGSPGLRWVSDGSGHYEISPAEEAEVGTKILLHLNAGDDAEFAQASRVEEVVKRYSNFVPAPIYLNGERVNSLQALWAQPPKDVSREAHEEFYKFTAHASDRPRYTLHYNLDAPVRIQALLYIPEAKPTMFDLAAQAASGGQEMAVALYSRRILIQSHSKDILPRWCRFLKGVVDSEDIPLNLSRELLQQSALIRKIRDVIGARVRKSLLDAKKKDPAKFEEFHRDYGLYLKEAIISSPEQREKEDIASLLLFESSNRRKGTKVSLGDYVGASQEDQKEIYYLCAPNRELAEASPYLEALKERRHEILFAYEPYDEVTLLQLGQFGGRPLVSVEKSSARSVAEEESDSAELSKREADAFLQWIQLTLGSKKVTEIKASRRLASHPALVQIEEMGAARHFVRMGEAEGLTQDQRYMLLKPKLEVSLRHPIMSALAALRKTEPKLAEAALEQVYDNAMVAAGLLQDARPMVGRLNSLLGELMSKAVTAKETILRP